MVRDVSVNGVRLTELDNRIFVNRITEKACSLSPVTQARGSGIGSDVLSTQRQNIDVTVEFNFRGLGRSNEAGRKDLLKRVAAWAVNGGWMKTTARGVREKLRVICVTLPSLGDPRSDWASDYSVVFRALTVPFWIGDDRVSASVSGVTGANLRFSTTNSAPSPVSVECTPVSGTLANLKLTLNGKVMQFNGLSVPSGQTFVLTYTDDGLQQIRASGGASLMDKRTTGSADDLMLPIGGGTLNFAANVACNVTAYVYERWV